MLKDIPFKLTYSSGYEDAEPKDFFVEALMESNTFDLGLGFFSSSGIRCLAYGFAVFIAHGGRMRVVINNILSDEDKAAIEKGQSKDVDNFEENILSDIKKLVATLSKEDRQFFNCFSYLISINRIEFVATISSKGGLGHDKYGIFTDSKGDKVAFIGSANFSQAALESNGETITVFKSWEDKQYVKVQEDLFEDSWKGNSKHLTHIPIERVKSYIQENFKPESLEHLIANERELRQQYSMECGVAEDIDVDKASFSSRIMEKLDFYESEPRFPYPEERQIQKDAYSAWVSNDRMGIFAMATGAGKTITALNCLLKDYHQNGFYKAIIVVPTQALALQWERECTRFNFSEIVSTLTENAWKYILERYITNSFYNTKKNIIIITTYATFNRPDIQRFVQKVRGIETFLYIADEAHNLGSKGCLSKLPGKILNRIGLSATPERVYDDLGSKEVYNFFNSYPPSYTYRYTMKQAIWDDDILSHYTYHPIFVRLNDEEMNEYEYFTQQLRKFIDSVTGEYKKGAEKLLLLRKQIIHKAQNKKVALETLLDELNDNEILDYTFVFVPEGYEPDYAKVETSTLSADDIHIIDEYGEMFRRKGYKYHKYITGLEDAPEILRNFANGDIQVLLSMKCLDEGVDIPRAEKAIFCSSTGNPRQFVQRRGRVLRKCKGKDKATIWDMIVLPPESSFEVSRVESGLFRNEVRRIVNFAALADNRISIIQGDLKQLCEHYLINIYDLLEKELEQYK